MIRQYLASVFESLFINKVRTALAILGIVIGIAAVVSLLSIGESNKKQIQSQFESLGTNLITVLGPPSNLTTKDLTAIRADKTLSFNGISPELTQQSDAVHGKKTKSAQVVGATQAYLQVHNTAMHNGTFVSDDGLSRNLKIAVLGPEIAKYLFGDGVNPVGSKLVIGGQNYTVVGVTKAKGGDAFSSPDSNIYVPLSTAQNRLFGTQNLSSISLSMKQSKDAAIVKSKLMTLLLARHKITDPKDANFQIQSQQDILDTLSSISGSINNLLTTIAAISLIVGGIGIMNVMLVTIIERTSEIGLRKAVGAKSKDIVAQFLGEAVVLTVLGGAIGVLAGYGVSLFIFSCSFMLF